MSLLRKALGRAHAWLAPAQQAALPAGYRAYTKEFDRVATLDDVAKFIEPPSADLIREHESIKRAFHSELADWRASANAQALLLRNEIMKASTAEERAATDITVLVDLSGSMKGQRIMLVVAALQVMTVALEGLNVSVEILGFTTVAWKGGRARQAWLQSGRPASPGRLADLLHIIVATPGMSDSARSRELEKLLDPNLLKENIDGEALEWAAGRLASRDAACRRLIVISDGVPADDATLAANDMQILNEHLSKTVADLSRESDIGIFAIGIDHDLSHFYPNNTKIMSPDSIFDACKAILRADFFKPGALGRGSISTAATTGGS